MIKTNKIYPPEYFTVKLQEVLEDLLSKDLYSIRLYYTSNFDDIVVYFREKNIKAEKFLIL